MIHHQHNSRTRMSVSVESIELCICLICYKFCLGAPATFDAGMLCHCSQQLFGYPVASYSDVT